MSDKELTCEDGVLIAMHIAADKFADVESRMDEFIEGVLGALGEDALIARAEEMGQMELSGLGDYLRRRAAGKEI